MTGKKILLVEDELFLLELYTKILQQAGYTVISAADGEAGLRLAQQHTDANVLLLDIMLPKMHGVDVLERLKTDPATKHLPVIMLSNLTEEGVIHHTLRVGAHGYFVKVRVPPSKLVQKINECIAAQEDNPSG